MKRPTAAIVAGAVVLLGAPGFAGRPAFAQTVLIDFETYPGGDPVPEGARITTQYLPWGVELFSTTDPLGPVICRIALAGQSGLNTLGGAGGFYEPISMDFAQPIIYCEILALDVGDNGLILEAFNSQSQLVDSMTVVNPGLGVGEIDPMWVAGSDIVLVTARQVTPGVSGDGYVMDDLTYTIPEPLTMSLLALGGLAVVRRRRGA